MKISHDKADAEAILRRPASRMMDWAASFCAGSMVLCRPRPRTGCGQYDAVATTDPTPGYFSSTIEPQDYNLKYRSHTGREDWAPAAVGRRIETALFCGVSCIPRTMHPARRAVFAFTAFRINRRDLLPSRSIATKSPT